MAKRLSTVPARAWIGAARARRWWRVRRNVTAGGDQLKAWMKTHVPDRSFSDIGCMWGIDGEYLFEAEDLGATGVTGFDGMPPTERFVAEHARRGSNVRFIQGDLHDPVSVEQVGVHDIVLCSGVIYHSPHPVEQLDHLHRITGDLLLLGSHTIPEVPGLPNACVFYPGLDAAGRAVYARAHTRHTMPGITEPFDGSRHNAYANMWWGISPSALEGMLGVVGFEVVDRFTTPAQPFFTEVIARRIDVEPSIPAPELNRIHAEEARAAGLIPDFSSGEPTR